MAKNKCNICSSDTYEVCNFGEIYISNFIKKEEKSSDYPKSNLALMYCDICRSAQLSDTINPDVLYKTKYWYYSGINSTMRNALRNVVNSICDKVKYKAGDVWMDIASNDGTLLSFVPKEYLTIGVDPSDENIINLARQNADMVINDYFSSSIYPINKKAKVITCIAMFYDLVDPVKFVQEVYKCLDDDGLFVMQMSYTPLMLAQLEFGNICAEHVMYHSLISLYRILNIANMKIVDCELNDVNGGSIRIYATKQTKEHIYGNQQQRDVGWMRTSSLMTYESSCYNSIEFDDFYKDISKLKQQTVEFIKNVVNDGKKVYAYGASTKGNMLLQYFGLDNTLISKVADRNSQKWGLKTIGTEIPICSEEEMRKDRPDYLLVLPWYFLDEFKERESSYLEAGGHFIVPCPKFEVI